MEAFESAMLIKPALVLAGLVVGWILLRRLLRITARLFALGCFGLTALVVLGLVVRTLV